MTIVYYIWDVLYASANRLLARKVTTFAAVLGLTIAISILLSISIYADGIYYESFLNNVADTRENPENEGSTDNPTFAFLYHYNSGWHGLKTWNDLLPLDNYLTQDGVNFLDIPSIDVIRLFETDTFYLFPEDNSADINSLYLSRSKFGVMTNLDKHASLVAGRFPNSNTNSHKDSVEIIVNQNLAAKAGLRINQDFLAYFKIITASGERETIHVPVHIVGIWKPTNPAEDYWIFAPSYYEQILFTGEETFFSRLGSNFPKFIDSGYWYLIMDADYVHADEIDSLLRRIDRMERGANEIIPDLWLSISPRNALEEYQIDARTLRILLYAFSIPIIGMVLAFINLVSHLTTQQRRNEIAVIRSRGGTVNQVIGYSALDGLIISIVSLSLIPFISMWLAKFISRTVSYSQFSTNSAMRISFSRGAFQIGFFAILIFLGMLLIPISRASQLTIISYRNLISRITKNPWWQRAWLDLILLIPAVYGFYLLREQGSLAQLGTQGMSNDPFRNPILFLIPSLGILSLSLFSLRLISPFITFLEVLISWTPWTSLIIASRQIARRPIDYHAPLLILILTISLFVYTASLATTFDQHLAAQEYYRIGADVQFFDPGDSTVSGDNYMWDFFPVDEYAGIEGVQSAARMGRYAVVLQQEWDDML
jgi:putative ABC transport system permease protein